MAIILLQIQKGKYMILVAQYRYGKKNKKVSGEAML
jgi:hypothetical protein